MVGGECQVVGRGGGVHWFKEKEAEEECMPRVVEYRARDFRRMLRNYTSRR